MVINSTTVTEVSEHVLGLLNENLSEDMTYHSIQHTKEVVRCANEIASSQQFTSEELEILNIAAWFHDVGYIKSNEEHEQHSAIVAKEFLSGISYGSEKIKQVENCILATKMPQKPKNLIEKTLCDADLMHLAGKDYFKKADLLHNEIEKVKLCSISEEEWMQMNQKFLTEHQFFTDYAKRKYEAAVQENLNQVRERLEKWKDQKK